MVRNITQSALLKIAICFGSCVATQIFKVTVYHQELYNVIVWYNRPIGYSFLFIKPSIIKFKRIWDVHFIELEFIIVLLFQVTLYFCRSFNNSNIIFDSRESSGNEYSFLSSNFQSLKRR